MGSAQESVSPPDFIGVGPCRYQQPAAVVAVEMWEPAFGAGFQARWDGQQIFGQDAARGPPERHFHSEPGILPILIRILSLAAAQDQNVRFQKPAQNEHFYRLSCRARFCQALFIRAWANTKELSKKPKES